MIFADLTRSLKAKLSGAIATSQLPITGAWTEVATTGSVVDQQVIHTVTNSATAVTVVPSPATGIIRKLQGLSVYNADTATATFQIYSDDGANTRIILLASLATGDVLTISDDGSWEVKDSNGAVKIKAASPVGTPLPSTKFWLGNSANVAAEVSMSGDGTLSNTGVFTLAATIATVVTWSGAQVFTGTVSSKPTGSGIQNERYGAGAMAATVTGDNNSAVGKGALAALTSGTGNMAFGTAALAVCTTGQKNVGIGLNALVACTTGVQNMGIGQGTLSLLTTGGGNVAIGDLAGRSITTQSSNVAIGQQAMFSGGAATCTAIGNNALIVCAGDNNVAVGHVSGYGITSGANNSYLGTGAGQSNTTGSYNVGVGVQAGGTTLTTGTGNSLLGANSDVASASQNFGTAIGYGAICAANSLAIGPNHNSVVMQVLSSTSAMRTRAEFVLSNVDNTDASRKYRLKLNVYDTSAREVFSCSGSGTVAQLSFFGVAESARAAAVTQTYSTADRTHAARTAAALTDNTSGTAGTTIAAIPNPADTPADADALRDDLVTNVLPKIRDAIASLTDQINKGRADSEDTAQLLNSIIDDFQAYGLEQ